MDRPPIRRAPSQIESSIISWDTCKRVGLMPKLPTRMSTGARILWDFTTRVAHNRPETPLIPSLSKTMPLQTPMANINSKKKQVSTWFPLTHTVLTRHADVVVLGACVWPRQEAMLCLCPCPHQGHQTAGFESVNALHPLPRGSWFCVVVVPAVSCPKLGC